MKPQFKLGLCVALLILVALPSTALLAANDDQHRDRRGMPEAAAGGELVEAAATLTKRHSEPQDTVIATKEISQVALVELVGFRAKYKITTKPEEHPRLAVITTGKMHSKAKGR